MAIQAVQIYESPLEGTKIEVLYDDVALQTTALRFTAPVTSPGGLFHWSMTTKGQVQSGTWKPPNSSTLTQTLNIPQGQRVPVIITTNPRTGFQSITFQGIEAYSAWYE